MLFFIQSIFSQEPINEDNPIIIWEPIPNAISYKLQVRDEDENIILEEKNVTDTSYKLNLDTGKYSHRVGAYNKFNKISSYSEWIPFTIYRSLTPEVTSEKKIISSKNEKEKNILIQGKYFYKNTIIHLKNKTGNVPILKKNFKNNTYELVLDNKNAKAGNYNLILENPRKKILIIKDYYNLQPESFFTSSSNATYPYWKEAAMSTVVPGLGQVKKNQIFSAIFLDIIILSSAGYYNASLSNFHSEKRKYDQSITMGIVFQMMKIPGIPVYNLMNSENYFNQVVISSQRTQQVAIATVALYGLNILHALLWKTSVKTAQNEKRMHFYTNIQNTSFSKIHSTNSIPNSPHLEIGIQIRF